MRPTTALHDLGQSLWLDNVTRALLSSGTLQLGLAGTNRIPDASAVTVSGGAIFDVNGQTETIGSLAGAGNTTLGAGALTAGGNGGSTTYSGIMSGTGTFTKAGAGTLTMSGANTCPCRS